jgi:hypothetical protein
LSAPVQPARHSSRVAFHEGRLVHKTTVETVEFARRRDKRRTAAKAARAARKKSRR